MNYPRYKLSQLGFIGRGKSRHRPRHDPILYGGKYPFIQTGDIKNSGRTITNFEQTYNEVGLAQSKLWPKGTLCITIAANIAETAILGFDACFPDSVVGFIPDKEKCTLDYIYYYLRFFKKEIQNQAYGTVQENINLQTLEKLEIPIPPLQKQKDMTTILRSLDEKIELNNQINKNLEEMAQAIFKSWFVDFEPFQDGEFVESELGLIPKGWEVGNFNKLVSELIGGDWGKEEPQKNHQQKVYCIRGADIPEVARGNKGKIPVRYILEKNALKKSLKSGDIVIEISGGSPTQSTGRAVLINDELLERFDSSLICTNFCRVIKLKEDYYSNFVYLYLKYLYEKEVFFQFENGTTGIKNLDINSFLEVYQIVIPSKEILNKFNNLVDKCFSSIQQLGKENEILSNLRDTLLPKLMSGEIRVPLENEGRHQDEQLQRV